MGSWVQYAIRSLGRLMLQGLAPIIMRSRRSRVSPADRSGVYLWDLSRRIGRRAAQNHRRGDGTCIRQLASRTRCLRTPNRLPALALPGSQILQRLDLGRVLLLTLGWP